MQRSAWLVTTVSAAVVISAVACSATSERGASGSGAANASTSASAGGAGKGSGGSGSGGSTSNAGNTSSSGISIDLDAGTSSSVGAGGGSSSGCPANAQMVYVTGEPAELWSFWPPTFTFTKIGDVTCTSPTHMTVDRTGTAWIVGDGNVYKTSTTTAACSLAPNWQPQADFDDFAVSFVGLSNTDTSLYVLGASTGELGKFDTATGAFSVVGTPSVGAPGGDMTSRGDGNLWYLQAYTSPHPLYEIDPTTAGVIKTYSVNAAGVGSQALAYFGARFYAFEGGNVYEYDPVANTVQLLGPAPLEVTGAGQSTCVPTVTVDAGTPPPVQ